MPLRDIIKRKESNAAEQQPQGAQEHVPTLHPPKIRFLRTTTDSQEEIKPPQFPGDPNPAISPPPTSKHSFFHRQASDEHRSLRDRLHLHRHRSASSSSVNLPSDLPAEPEVAVDANGEAEWEKRATIMVKGKASRSASPSYSEKSAGVSDEPSDVNVQEAIRLHEAGDLARSTEMFGRLANPKASNNALSQVLYGLALRHGWGVKRDEPRAVQFLTLAASNSADIESQALATGASKGGAAKGELTLAMFELANCYRNGWGVVRDPIAARNFYETAANMGDTDAMNEAAWCYMEGFGCKKDKFKAARYLRRADELGKPQVGNTWIWKDKYGGPKKVASM